MGLRSEELGPGRSILPVSGTDPATAQDRSDRRGADPDPELGEVAGETLPGGTVLWEYPTTDDAGVAVTTLLTSTTGTYTFKVHTVRKRSCTYDPSQNQSFGDRVTIPG